MNPYFLLDSISTEKIYIHQFTFSNIPVCYYISFHDTRARRCRDNRCIIFPIKQLHLPAISNGCVIYYLHEKDIFKTFFRHHNILIYCKLMHCPWHICEISSRNYFKSSESSCWFAWKCKTGVSFTIPTARGFPGLIATLWNTVSPASAMISATKSRSPTETPPVVNTKSKFSHVCSRIFFVLS